MRHRIYRIEHKVREHLTQLTGIAQDVQVGRHGDVHVDVLTAALLLELPARPRQLDHVLDEFLHRHGLIRRGRRRTRELPHALDRLRAVASRLLNGVDGLPQERIYLHLGSLRQDLRASDDDH